MLFDAKSRKLKPFKAGFKGAGSSIVSAKRATEIRFTKLLKRLIAKLSKTFNRLFEAWNLLSYK